MCHKLARYSSKCLSSVAPLSFPGESEIGGHRNCKYNVWEGLPLRQQIPFLISNIIQRDAEWESSEWSKLGIHFFPISFDRSKKSIIKKWVIVWLRGEVCLSWFCYFWNNSCCIYPLGVPPDCPLPRILQWNNQVLHKKGAYFD